MICWICEGTGHVCVKNPANGGRDEIRDCPACGGKGERPRVCPANWPYNQLGMNELLNDESLMSPLSQQKPDLDVKDDPSFPWSPKP